MSEIVRYTNAIPPLSTIKDTDTRRVLEALVGSWRTRNGDLKPESDERFITKGELAGLVGGINNDYFKKGAGQDLLASQPVPGVDTTAVLDAVIGSPLWTDLGSRISLIRLAGNKTGAGLDLETTYRANSDNALASAVNTLWAALGDGSAIIQTGATGVVNRAGAVATSWNQTQAAIQDPTTHEFISTATVRTEAAAVASRVDGVEAKYTVKIDVNGYVAGYGLIATANGAAATSEFIVRADKFSIGTASGPSIPPVAPFSVLTTTDAQGNPAGVYMNTAFIKKASITSAYISNSIQSDDYVANTSGWYIRKSDGYAEFGNIKARGDIQATSLTAGTVYTTNIVGNAATVSYVTNTSGATASVTVSVPSGASSAIIMVALGGGLTSGGGESISYFPPFGDLTIDGTLTLNNSPGNILYAIVSPDAGSHTVSCTRGSYSGTMSLIVMINKR